MALLWTTCWDVEQTLQSSRWVPRWQHWLKQSERPRAGVSRNGSVTDCRPRRRLIARGSVVTVVCAPGLGASLSTGSTRRMPNTLAWATSCTLRAVVSGLFDAKADIMILHYITSLRLGERTCSADSQWRSVTRTLQISRFRDSLEALVYATMNLPSVLPSQ